MGGVDLMQELAVLNHGGGGGSSKGTVAHLLLLHLKKTYKIHVSHVSSPQDYINTPCMADFAKPLKVINLTLKNLIK